jgi:primosomal protein N' (replication factor Y)
VAKLVEDLRADGSERALSRAMILEAIRLDGQLPLAEARLRGLTDGFLRSLRSRGLMEVADLPVVRDPLAGRSYPRRNAPELTEPQSTAADEIIAAIDGGSGAGHGFLLHGVTGSGKTEVYLAALEHAIAQGKRGIVLVPEIALTPQTIRRFAERFPGEVAVLHSELSLGEQYDVWHEARDGRYKVVIGARGALFVPMPNLGLVVIDEEHEWTYKQQDASPRYHARAAAEELCRLTAAVLVLGSATPDVETHFRAEAGSLRLLELKERLVRSAEGVKTAPLPAVEVVDLREELKAGNRSIFSRSLAREMEAALEAGGQVILFLNRRGTASFLQCRDCGHVPPCRSCSVALTYHEPEGRLVCHYCNRRYPVPAACPECGSGRVRRVGLGTERVEEETHARFPEARTVRWDRDVTGGRGSHETILAKFLAHEADILIGTQMVAKGLDIPSVTLVGVVSADVALHLPDFRAGERTFQLLEQVAGRAGRGDRGGRVIIQTYTPDHYGIEAASHHDYHALFAHETSFRQKLGYPPFGRLARLTFAHSNAERAREEAAETAQRLRVERDRRGLPNLDVLGPAPAFVPRVRGRWRWSIIVRGANPAELLEDEALPRGWVVDIDPASLL